MKKRIWIVLVALLITVLSACSTPKMVKLTGSVNLIQYTYNRTTIRYGLEKVVFDEGSQTCEGTNLVDVPADKISESVQLNQSVHVQCFCDDLNSVPVNACNLIPDGPK